MIERWHKSETRDVRPFFEAVAIQNVLDGAEIQLFREEEFTGKGAFSLPPEDLPKLSLAIRPKLTLGPLREFEKVPASDLAFAVILTNRFVKRSVVLGEWALDDSIPQLIEVDDDQLRAVGIGGSLDVTVAICAKRGLGTVPGLPSERGQWLAKKTFSVRLTKESPEFDVQSKSDADWESMGLPAKTLFNVRYIGFINEPSSPDQSIAEVGIHEDAFKALTSDAEAHAHKGLLSVLAVELTAQILAQSFKDWESAEEVTPRSPLSAIMKRLSGKKKLSFEDLKSLVRDPGMPKLRAILQNDQRAVRAVVES